jgi:hypothetical protein
VIVKQGTYRGLWWKITQSDSVAWWNRVLSVGDAHGCGHSEHVERHRYLGDPWFVERRINSLIEFGCLPNLAPKGNYP